LKVSEYKKGTGMNNLKAQIQATMILGVLALLAGIVGHLALTDIYHNEVNVTLEWNILRICSVILLAFIGASLITLRKAIKAL